MAAINRHRVRRRDIYQRARQTHVTLLTWRRSAANIAAYRRAAAAEHTAAPLRSHYALAALADSRGMTSTDGAAAHAINNFGGVNYHNMVEIQAYKQDGARLRAYPSGAAHLLSA